MKIAVIGTGISGLGAAYALSKGHEVELFERDDRAGGHSNTVEHMAAGRTLRLDTGFIVHNEDTYPNLVRLFRELGVRTQPSEMSFSVACDRHGLEYSGSRPPLHAADARDRPLPAPRAAGLSTTRAARSGASPATSPRRATRRGSGTTSSSRSAPRSGRPLPARRSTSRSSTPSASSPTTASSASGASAGGRSPAAARPTCGPSRSGCASTSRPRIRSIRRLDGGVELRLAGDELRRFDGVVVATHADQALRLLEDPSEDERRLLGAFGTTENDTVLHTDERFLPRRVSTRGSWNYQLRDCGCDDGRPTMTYYLNKLQRLDEDEHYCVTLNRTAEIDPARIIRRFSYRHPLVTLESMRAQPELPRLNGPRRTAFAGAWQGYCFHEDGLRSGLAAAAAFGATW